MSTGTSNRYKPAPGPIPRRLIVVVVLILCLCLFGSALFTFTTLTRLRALYLSNRAHVIAEAIDAQARGPGKRNNPIFWQSLLETSFETYSGSVAYLALVDQKGNSLAAKGDSPPGPLSRATMRDSGIYHFEESLSRPRNQRGEPAHSVAGWRIRIGLYSAEADFIGRLAYWQLLVACGAIIALIALSVYLMRMLHRFLELKEREGAEAQLKSLGVMAAALAHEIRNPLGAMKGLTQLAQEDIAPDDAAQARLRTVVTEAERLEGLVTNLLDFARPKEPQISEFDLRQLLSDLQAMLQSKLQDSGIHLQIRGAPDALILRSDSNGLRQVLLNVLLNAVDAAPAGSTVTLQVLSAEDGGSIEMRIEDAGPGLGDRDPDELFQPFVTTKSRGTGLGLAVSRQIVERLGGRLRLSNIAEGGARCTIQLPLRKEWPEDCRSETE